MGLSVVELTAAGMALTHLAMALYASGHVLLTRREPTAAVLWLLFVIIVPVVGPILYSLMGLHRVHRTHRLRGARKAELRSRYASLTLMGERRKLFLGTAPGHVQILSDAIGKLTGRSLLSGNRLEVLVNGENAYPRMLDAIEKAQHSVHLLSYIFDDDDIGQRFLDALSRTAKRGVEVRVIYDAIGAIETSTQFFEPSRRAGVQVGVARPLTLARWRRGLHFRNHRKLLICDGMLGFTGGMNISTRYLADNVENEDRCRDFHFEVRGPVVGQMQEVFIEDWFEATQQTLISDTYFPALRSDGNAVGRVISSSPAGEYEYIHSLFFQAISCARERIEIVTPYFIPDMPIFCALRAAVQRGVQVNVVIPGRGDSAFVQAASFGMVPDLLAIGVNIFVREPPFLHAKALVVDGVWATVGSANFDARSFRFLDEVNIEVIDADFIKALEAACAEERRHAVRWSASMTADRPLARRLWERTAALFAPTL